MAMVNKRYPAGVQSFSAIREGNYVYVDKTDLVYRLVNQGAPVFLSRPRRFGKSLLISTIEAYFLGQRELFKGLAIDSLTDDWDPHPVLHIDLSGRNYDHNERINQVLNIYISEWEKLYGSSETEVSVEDRFYGVITRAYTKTGKKVVVLIDEYDKPLLDTIDEDRADSHRYYKEVLRGFYGCLKNADRYLRFVMLTGVTKFSQVSIFSGLNNLIDISLVEDYSTICGITPEEISECLPDGVRKLADRKRISFEQMLEELRKWYDGYHFASDLRDVYNPFSLMAAFNTGKISNYWYQSGNPSFLIKKIKNDGVDLFRIQQYDETEMQLSELDLASTNPIPLMFQSGYLTIKAYDEIFDTYTLDYPNEEVKKSFLDSMVPYYVASTRPSSPIDLKRFTEDVEEGDIEGFMNRFQALFAGFPYDQVADCELHYHNVIYLTFTLLGFYVRTEYKTSDGRCDAVVETDRYVYIFEFKYDRSAEEALRQIEDKGYALPFAADKRTIIKVGVNFSSEIRRINDFKIKKD